MHPHKSPTPLTRRDALRRVGNGFGMTVRCAAEELPDYIAAPELHSRRLVRLLPQWQVEGRFGTSVWIVRPPQRAVLPAVRAFTEFIADALRENGVPRRAR